MRFRPCIDLQNGRVKLLTEAGLTGEATPPLRDASFYAAWYAMQGYADGFLMMHNRDKDPIFEKTYAEAKRVLFARPSLWNAGGRMTPDIAERALSDGAKRAVFGSFVFRAGGPDTVRLNRVREAFGKSRVILHLRLIRRDSSYHLLSGALDHGSSFQLTEDRLDSLAAYCSEMVVETPGRGSLPDDAAGAGNALAGAADIAGTPGEIEAPLVLMLARWNKMPVTYLRGIRDETDINLLEQMGSGRLDFSAGRELALYGGELQTHTLSYYK